jgi:hypothetical protein
MHWALAGITLVIVGIVSRRLLQMDQPAAPCRDSTFLSAECEKIYRPVALELQTQAAILGISLNEALAEREHGSAYNAVRLVQLAASQWDRLSEMIGILLKVIDQNISTARSVVPLRNLDPHRFRSKPMLEFVRMRNTLDQLIFRTKVRYQVQIRVLRQAVEVLNADFRRTCGAMEMAPEHSFELWASLDPTFHDFDLLMKESLLCFRSFLAALPAAAVDDFAGDLSLLTSRSVRSRSSLYPPSPVL